jgi:hypothetical protein
LPPWTGGKRYHGRIQEDARRLRHIHHGVFGRIVTQFCRLSACPDPAELEARCAVRCIKLSVSAWTTTSNGNQIGILRDCPGHGHA